MLVCYSYRLFPLLLCWMTSMFKYHATKWAFWQKRMTNDHYWSVEITCKLLDKGQKSTRCTSLRKLLGIFTQTPMLDAQHKLISKKTPRHFLICSPPLQTKRLRSPPAGKTHICPGILVCSLSWDGETSRADDEEDDDDAQLKDTRSGHHPRATTCDLDDDNNDLKSWSDIWKD